MSLVISHHHHHKHKQHIIIMITLLIFEVITTSIGNNIFNITAATATYNGNRTAAATATATTISSTQPLLRHQKPLSFQVIMHLHHCRHHFAPCFYATVGVQVMISLALTLTYIIL